MTEEIIEEEEDGYIPDEDNRIPINIITGFLGSGKTTLLNHWVNSPEFKDTLVLINEFGDVGLDHELVQAVDDTVVLLGSGCICCSLQGELIDSLAQNLAKSQAGIIPPFRRVIIETTGLADPAGVINTINGDEYLLDNYRYDGTVTVLDAAFVREQLKKQYEAVKQIALADLLLISKTDLVDQEEIDAIMEVAQQINPSVKIYPMVKGNISPKLLFEIGPYKAFNEKYDKKVTSWISINNKPNIASSLRPAQLSGGVGVAKPRIIAHTNIDSFALEYENPLKISTILFAVNKIAENYGDSVLRMKAILNIVGRDKPLVIQGVQGAIYPLSELDAWPKNDDKKSKIVFIVRETVLEQIKMLFNDCMTHPETEADYYKRMVENIDNA